MRIPETTELKGWYVVVRGGISPLPASGVIFSGVYGKTIEEAAAMVPHGTIRSSNVDNKVMSGGTIVVRPEVARSGPLNRNHIDITIGATGANFSEPFANHVPRDRRIK